MRAGDVRFRSWSGRAQANDDGLGRKASVAAKAPPSILKRRKLTPNGLSVRSRIAAVPALICSAFMMVAAHGAETAGIRHRGNEIGRIDRAHAAEDDRMLDLQEIAEGVWIIAFSPSPD